MRSSFVIILLLAAVAAPAPAAVVTAAGDIAFCSSSMDSATGNLVRAIDPRVALTLGDNAYPDGTLRQFRRCYDPAWGSFKAKTRPSAGNHDYHTDGAAGYFGYFGERAGPCCRGYYRYDVGRWRLYSLNSERHIAREGRWLAHDLRVHPHRCTLAYWHRPRFSDGTAHGDQAVVAPLWDVFAAHGGDVVLVGHEHDYQRFPRIDGVREFVVGTGGGGLYDVVPDRVKAYDDAHWGVLRFALRRGYYTWRFRIVGGTHTDAGRATCRR